MKIFNTDMRNGVEGPETSRLGPCQSSSSEDNEMSPSNGKISARTSTLGHNPTVLFFFFLALMALQSLTVLAQPQLNGAHFRITALQEHGFLDMEDDATKEYGTRFSGYLMDMMAELAQPQRANFTYTILPPSGYGSLCNPRLSLNNGTTTEFDASYRTQYNCGASDVNDGPNTSYATDMYLGLYYVTPARQLVNQFTIPYQPPTSGRLAMFGTATEIPHFEALVAHQLSGKISPDQTCGPAGTALIESVQQSFPGLLVRGIYGGEDEIYQAFLDQSCLVYITDGPIAAQFVLRRSRKEECMDHDGNPIGVIGDPMPFGLSHYAIGIRHDIDPHVADTLSYWMNILMTCNPYDPEGPCPDGNLATLYQGRGGTGAECGYQLYPTEPRRVSTEALAGIVIASIVSVVIVYTLWHRYKLARQKRRYAKRSKSAMAQAAREREFNEYMAHEIRNPLASAIAAITFVSSKTSDPDIVPDPEHRALIKSDMNVMDSSLQFVNELLRNMLDLHRAQTGHEIKLNLVPTDIMHDIVEPVSTILFMRGASVKIETIVHYPGNNLIIQADRMRLKQICLNLASNASKFVHQGYIRLRAEVVPDESISPSTEADSDVEEQLHNGTPSRIRRNSKSKTMSQRHAWKKRNQEHGASGGTVVIYVEDSGPGIPQQKREQLFTKFQDSLDVLNQGTGIGLSVCKKLSEAMGGSLTLDDDFDSGMPGCPGTSFRLQLNQAPLDMEQTSEIHNVSGFLFAEPDTLHSGAFQEDLPENLSVLFVDDDMVLRKMFSRVLNMTAPTWKIKEASNGETALKIVDEEDFDLIFVDQYMASVEKQLLGTETVRAMRSRGVDSIICGLSANDGQDQFSEAGADAFMAKPFPCKKDEFRAELLQMLLAKESTRKSKTLAS